MMKNHTAGLLMLLLLLSFSACEKESERMDNYLVEFATVENGNAGYCFRLDNGRLLIPEEAGNYSQKDGQRVILNYVPLEGDAIRVNVVSDIFTGTIQSEGFAQNYSDDPVSVQSIWVGGDWLNLILETEYHSKPHRIALFHDTSATTLDLYFSHSSEDDPPGYPQKIYASFLLSDLREQSGGIPATVRLLINTYTGIRVFELEI